MKYKSDRYSVSIGKNIIAQLYVGGTLKGNNELRIKQGMPREEVIKKIIEDCPQFAKQYNLTEDYHPKLF